MQVKCGSVKFKLKKTHKLLNGLEGVAIGSECLDLRAGGCHE